MMINKTTYLTPEGHIKLKDELVYLKNTKRPEIANRIKEAKELGDLSENAEYADAREEQSFVEGRILEIESVLKNAKVISSKESDPNQVDIGDTVLITRDGQDVTCTIVGSNESDPANGKISNESPLGKALLGSGLNEEVEIDTPRGKSKCKILKITAN